MLFELVNALLINAPPPAVNWWHRFCNQKLPLTISVPSNPMLFSKPLRALSLLGTLALLSSTASAAYTVYTDRTAWNEAVSEIQTDDFEAYDFDSPSTVVLSNPVTLGMNTYSYNEPQFYGVDSDVLSSDASYLTGNYIMFLNHSILTVAFNTPVTAFGLDFSEFSGGSRLFYFGLSNWDNFAAQGTDNAWTFFGITHSTPFTFVEINVNQSYPIIDNISTGTARVPDYGTTIGMLGMSLVGFAVARLRSAARV
jgi:hypothetical protein